MALTTLTVAAPRRDSTASIVTETVTNADTYFLFAAPKAGKFMIHFSNDSNSAPVFSVLAGTGLHAGQGNLSLTIAASTADYAIGPLSTSRFKSMSGTTAYINISMPTVCTTGEIAVVALP
mgnify:CR=1 FL=1